MRSTLALCLPLLALLLAFFAKPLDAADRPNFLLIISDDQAWGDYSFMGHPHINTPNLDRLAAESLTYTRGYVTAPLCRPSLASILTGLPVHRHGISGNDPRIGDRSIRGMASRLVPRYAPLHQTLYDRIGEAPNMVRALRQAGYRTLQTGKWWEADPADHGFTAAMTHGDPKRGGRHGDAGLKISREGIQPIQDFLDDTDGEPFFIWHAPFLPHTPHNPPEELLARYQEVAPTESVAKYWAMCDWFDQTCGELLDELDQRGLRENTVVLYVTDNGWIQDPERVNRFAPRSKQSPNEGGIRTPIMVRWPGHVQPMLDTQTLACATDIAPTVLAMASIEPSSELPGLDLRDRQLLIDRNAAFGAAYSHDIPDVENPTAGLVARYGVVGPWKLIAPADDSQPMELYHLEADPHEQHNLAATRPARAEAMLRQLDAWWSPNH